VWRPREVEKQTAKITSDEVYPSKKILCGVAHIILGDPAPEAVRDHL
jgi:hypothetical protein